MRTLDSVLADVPLLRRPAAPLTLDLDRRLRRQRSLSLAAQYLFREGDPADVFYVVRHGSVALETFVPARGAVTIETLEAGEVLGWSWLFPPTAGTSTPAR